MLPKNTFRVTLRIFHQIMRQNGEGNAQKKGICCLIFFTQDHNLVLGRLTTTAKAEQMVSFFRGGNSKVD